MTTATTPPTTRPVPACQPLFTEGSLLATADYVMTPCAYRLPARRRDLVRAAVSEGAEAVTTLALTEIAKRMATATADNDKRHWSTYRLWHPTPARPEDRYSLINPDGVLYEAELTDEGVVRYPDCPDQAFCDYLNLALDAFGVPLRVETKHSWIARRLREAREETR